MSSESFPAYAEVALPVPLPRSFSYGIPERLLKTRPGSRVQVRFGPRFLVGCVTAVSQAAPRLPEDAKLLAVSKLLDEEPVLSAEQLALAEWIADYYLASPGIVCRGMLPPETPRGETILFERVASEEVATAPSALGRQILEALIRPMSARAVARAVGRKTASGALATLLAKGHIRKTVRAGGGGPRKIRTATVTEKGRKALEQETLHPTTARILTLLSVATDAVPLSTVRHELSVERGPFNRLAAVGYIEMGEQSLPRTPWERLEGDGDRKDVSLTPAQTSVLKELESAIEARGYRPFVLEGVTGSGKTEVYLRAAEAVLQQGRNVLILVPEIALTPRLAALLQARFRGQVAILHSALGSGERRDEWWRIRRGAARVVVGARAAVLAPVHSLGLVVVDEEHESSYKQEESPRYSARDVAIVRAHREGAVAILGSATPSLESYTHALESRYRLLQLPVRVGRGKLASVELLDMKDIVREEGPDTILSGPLRAAIDKRIEENEQAIVLMNRRGFAGQLICRQCGLSLTCTECSVSLTLHKGGTLAMCHYCGLGRPTPSSCDVCQGEYMKQKGYGTERIEQVVKELWPDIRVARMDRDTMRKKGSYEKLLARFAARELDILVGTQMLAKGHDFPAVTLVGVLGADAGLGVPDFRAAEKTFQLLTQVAGRAGRGDRPGEVLIQTFAPDHYSLQFARSQDFQGFYATERKFRSALRYPPVSSLINLVIEGATMGEASTLARRIAAFMKGERLDDVDILGPAFAVRSKVAGRHRCQILIKLSRRQHPEVRSLLRSVMKNPDVAKSLLVDVDPLSLF